VEELVAKWGTKWRTLKERGWFQRRQKLIDELYELHKKASRRRLSLCKTLRRFVRNSELDV
jgi:transcriptional activator of glycolytic enzymes GCR1